MRIAVLSDAVLPTPSPGGHGLGRVVSTIAERLLQRGHDVTLFAKQGSRFSGALVMPADANGYAGEKALAREAMRMHRQYPFDVFLDNSHVHALADMFPDLPMVNVYHDNYQQYQRCAVILSKGQRALLPPEFERARIIPNTLDAADYPANYTPDARGFALFMGALSEIKQPFLAIEACAKMGIPLVMAGSSVYGKLPFDNLSNVQYVGIVTGGYKQRLLNMARVFLQLGTMESFGLTTLEAGLSGTPVVAWPAGGSLDLIRYGVNGVFVPPGKDRVGNTCDAIERAWSMNREVVRVYSESLCNPEAQLEAYEDTLGACMRGEWW